MCTGTAGGTELDTTNLSLSLNDGSNSNSDITYDPSSDTPYDSSKQNFVYDPKIAFVPSALL